MAALVGLFVGGCYKPTIKGAFKCNTDYAPGMGDCPEGTHCSAGLCVKGPVVDAGIDLGPETKDDGHADATPEVPPVDMTPELPACYSPVAGCTADSGN